MLNGWLVMEVRQAKVTSWAAGIVDCLLSVDFRNCPAEGLPVGCQCPTWHLGSVMLH